MPTSERTEYLPPIKSLCSIISVLNFLPILTKLLSFNSVIITNLFFNKDSEKIIFKFVIVSRVFPDFETTIKHEFFKFFIFLYTECKFGSKLSKKNTSFLIFFF